MASPTVESSSKNWELDPLIKLQPHSNQQPHSWVVAGKITYLIFVGCVMSLFKLGAAQPLLVAGAFFITTSLVVRKVFVYDQDRVVKLREMTVKVMGQYYNNRYVTFGIPPLVCVVSQLSYPAGTVLGALYGITQGIQTGSVAAKLSKFV